MKTNSLAAIEGSKMKGTKEFITLSIAHFQSSVIMTYIVSLTKMSAFDMIQKSKIVGLSWWWSG